MESEQKREKDVNKKVDTVFKAVIIGMAAVFLLFNPDFARFIPPELVIMPVSGIALILCINVVVFSFIKPRTWLYRVIAAILSLLIGYSYFQFFIDSIGLLSMSDLKGIVSDFLFYAMEEKPELSWVNIMEGVYLAYSAVIFGAALLVQYLYKRVKRKMANAL